MTDEKVNAGGAGGGIRWAAGAATGAVIAVAIWYFGVRPAEPPVPAGAPAGQATAPAPAEAPAAAEAPAGATPDQPAPDDVPAATGEAAPPAEAPTEAQSAPESTAAGDEAAAPAAAVPPAPPSFDTVRVDADGSVVVAGRADGAGEMVLYLDAAEIARATAAANGAFATFFSIPPSATPRTLSLIRLMPDGTRVAAAQTVIIAPFAAPAPPEVVAVAEPPAAAAPATETAAPEAQPEGAEAPAAATEPAVVPGKAPEVLIADAQGVRKQTPAGSLAAVVIDTIGYGSAGEVRIAGRGTAGSFARLYLDNKPQETAPIDENGGWDIALADVPPGLYTLRVDQIDGAGKVTSRFETPFKRETAETVAAALVPAAPEGGGGTLPGAQDAAVDGTAAETAALPAGEAGAPGFAGADATGSAPPPAVRAGVVTVQPGFTLWRIARENYGEGILYVKVFEANKDLIRNPDLIYPGQIFNVPAP